MTPQDEFNERWGITEMRSTTHIFILTAFFSGCFEATSIKTEPFACLFPLVTSATRHFSNFWIANMLCLIGSWLLVWHYTVNKAEPVLYVCQPLLMQKSQHKYRPKQSEANWKQLEYICKYLVECKLPMMNDSTSVLLNWKQFWLPAVMASVFEEKMHSRRGRQKSSGCVRADISYKHS